MPPDAHSSTPPTGSRPRGRRAALGAALALAAVGAAWAGIGPAGAAEIDQLNSQIAAARQQAEELSAEVDARTSALANAHGKATAAAKREADLTAVLAEGREREAELRVAVDEGRRNLDDARTRLRRAVAVLSDRLVAIYKGDAPDAASLVLEADGFDDLLTRTTYLRSVEDSDAELAARVRELRNQVQAQLEAVEEARREVAAHNTEVAAARAQIADVRAQAEARAAALESARAERAAALRELRSNIGAWTQRVQQLESVPAPDARETVADWVGDDWAIPNGIVQCESGGNYQALNPDSGAGGAYQILPSTWELYGGKGLPHEAPRGEQDRIAAQIWSDSGASAWECSG